MIDTLFHNNLWRLVERFTREPPLNCKKRKTKTTQFYEKIVLFLTPLCKQLAEKPFFGEEFLKCASVCAKYFVWKLLSVHVTFWNFLFLQTSFCKHFQKLLKKCDKNVLLKVSLIKLIAASFCILQTHTGEKGIPHQNQKSKSLGKRAQEILIEG